MQFGFFWAGCDSCKNVDCYPKFDEFRVSLVSESGEDLLSGGTKKYDLSDIKVFAIDQDDNKVYAGLFIFEGSPAELEVSLAYKNERSFIELNRTVTDTLDFEYTIYDHKCCGTGYVINETRLNGETQEDARLFEITEKN